MMKKRGRKSYLSKNEKKCLIDTIVFEFDFEFKEERLWIADSGKILGVFDKLYNENEYHIKLLVVLIIVLMMLNMIV